MIQYLNAASMPLELGCAVLLFAMQLPRRNRFWLRAACYLAISLLILEAGTFVSITEFDISPDVTSAVLLYAFCFFVFAWAVLYLLFCCNISCRQALYYSTCAYLLQHVVYRVSCLLVPEGDAGRTSSFYPGLLLLYVALYLAAYRLWIVQITRIPAENVTTAYTLALMVGSLCVTLLFSVIFQIYRQNGPLGIVCQLYAVFCCIYIINMELARYNQMKAEKEQAIQQQLWQQQKAQYEMSAANVELINRKCHDLKHQIAALKHISAQEQRDASIRELEESVMIYDSIVKTGNDILDTVLTEKSLLCDARGITLTCMADGRCVDFMDAVDVYTIFGNILDNAIESVSDLPSDQRIITVMVFARGG